MSEQVSVAQCLGDPGSVTPRRKKIVDGGTEYERLIDWQQRALSQAGHLRCAQCTVVLSEPTSET